MSLHIKKLDFINAKLLDSTLGLNYPGGCYLITSVLIRGSQESQTEKARGKQTFDWYSYERKNADSL